MAEEYLRNLRITLQTAEEEYRSHGKAAGIPYDLAARTLPFVVSVCASAKAATLASGNRMR
jgi:hypothetical protein